jgi:hypothetical protein
VARARASRRLRALSAHLILPPADDATAAARASAVAGLAGRPKDYRGLLLLAYEEELMGEILFADIATKLADPGQAQKMQLMSQVERHTADAVRPLLQRHGLTPRTDEELHRLVLSATSQDPLDWQEWMERALEGGDGPSLQEYVDEFLELEALGPAEDQEILEFFTEHERALLRFMQLELEQGGTGARRSEAELVLFLQSDPQSLRAARAADGDSAARRA